MKAIEANKNKNIVFGFKNIWKFEIKVKKIIANTTGIEDGLDPSNKNITKINSVKKILFLTTPFATKYKANITKKYKLYLTIYI